MKANEFVKRFGWKYTTDIFDLCNSNKTAIFTYNNDEGIQLFDDVSINDLKRLVESWELVEKFGGLETSKYLSNIGNLEDVKQAIADVESCQ